MHTLPRFPGFQPTRHITLQNFKHRGAVKTFPSVKVKKIIENEDEIAKKNQCRILPEWDKTCR